MNLKIFRYNISTRFDLHIGDTSGIIYANQTTNPFDYDIQPEESVTVIIKDLFGQKGCLSSDTLVKFQLTDVNDETPSIKPSTSDYVE